jgi:SPX domain protein involved in polyphosphate accumulation
MKFKTKLEAEKVQKWAKQYLDYEGLDALNMTLQSKRDKRARDRERGERGARSPGTEKLLDNSHQSEVDDAEEQDELFFEEVSRELVRVDTFYTDTLSELMDQCEMLCEQTLEAEANDAAEYDEVGGITTLLACLIRLTLLTVTTPENPSKSTLASLTIHNPQSTQSTIHNPQDLQSTILTISSHPFPPPQIRTPYVGR